ncbi:MaoC family dehydratase [Diaphorobacter sp. HDW4A]|nr:MaoC family dehydratase [Diaphorobacter sp. HDW4A]QIL83728.1 MaoC family dehydratase [Diaphorobacter sp. HDW4A]
MADPVVKSICRDLEDLLTQVGSEVYCSDWTLIEQTRIDRFAEATGDFQWIHVNPERAAQESPFGGTIAHGFLSLSLLGKHYEEFLPQWLPFCDIGINYGLNRVRFIQPVRSGSRVRSRFVLGEVSEAGGGVQMLFNVTVELQGQSKPALVAESVIRRQFRNRKGGPM